MEALAGHAGILTVIVAVVGLFVLALLAFPELRQQIAELGRRQANPFARIPARRRGMAGMQLPEEDVAPEAREPRKGDDAPAGHAGPAASSETWRPEASETNCLLALAHLCGRVDLNVQKVLTQAAELLATAFGATNRWSCKIELMESVCWSPGYITPAVEFEAPLAIAGTTVGSIRLGATGESAPTEIDAAGRALMDMAAALVGQMLERRSDRLQVEKLQGELERRQITVRQTARLARIGGWAYDGRTGMFHWSEEVRQITAIDSNKAGRERERLIAKELLPVAEESLASHKALNHEFTCQMPNGQMRCLHAVGDVESVNGQPRRIVGIIRDVTEDREALERLTHIANHDALTELPNRRYLLERIEDALLGRNSKGALLIIDIDRFKDLNDSSGHDVGDMMLRDFGRRLQEAAAGAFVARLGGDEFAVLLPATERMEAEHLARALIVPLSGPIVVFGRSTTVQVSAGLAMYPADGRVTTDLLKSADLALFEAKTRGRNMLVTYAPEIREASEQRASIRAEVRDALPNKQFVPFYQPKISLDTGEIAGFEALVRWNHPDGLRTPGSFMPALEDPELSRALCAATLDGIIADMARWQAKELPFGRVAFNASSSEFSGFDLAGHLTWRLRSIGIPPSCLGVEVTEAVFLDAATGSINATLEKLRAAGIEIALDDFGTGFASLTHLQSFPVDVIKIDQSFVRRLATDAGSRAITTAVVGLGHSLGKKVVAEGAESAEQVRLLKATGCDQVQGYYFGRPMPADNVPKFITNWHGAEQISALEKNAA
jgi:diguanylate cyclase (GGDEF)-like protein